MIHIDEEALICDFAETYHIYNYRSLPVKLAATLANGLRDDSRIQQKLSGIPADESKSMLAMITDAVNWLVWSKTKDGMNNVNPPERITEKIFKKKEEKKPEDDVAVFDSPEAFEEARKKALRKEESNG